MVDHVDGRGEQKRAYFSGRPDRAIVLARRVLPVPGLPDKDQVFLVLKKRHILTNCNINDLTSLRDLVEAEIEV